MIDPVAYSGGQKLQHISILGFSKLIGFLFSSFLFLSFFFLLTPQNLVFAASVAGHAGTRGLLKRSPCPPPPLRAGPRLRPGVSVNFVTSSAG
jgi:hypothetical protein